MAGTGTGPAGSADTDSGFPAASSFGLTLLGEGCNPDRVVQRLFHLRRPDEICGMSPSEMSHDNRHSNLQLVKEFINE